MIAPQMCIETQAAPDLPLRTEHISSPKASSALERLSAAR
jgi:hypothetical protein